MPDGAKDPRSWRRRGAILLALLIVAGIASLEALRVVAARRGVSEIELPPESVIAARADGANYIDAYRAPTHPDATLDAATFTMGREVARTESEIVWEGGAPGLRFLASYYLEEDAPRHFTLSTVVFYESWLGHVYFFFVKPVHRRLVPFMVSTMNEVAN